MIQVNELRYRNWITSKSSSVPFEVFIGDFEPIFDNPEHYFGIPLTEEWLLKFGFLKNDDWYGEFGHIDSWVVLRINDEKCYMCSNDGNVHLLHLQYVHQLQNLYFALTSKELEIK